jgi:general secretion pathway protein M
MNLILPTGRPGRALAAGLLGGLVLAGWFGVVAPFRVWHASRTEALAQRRLLSERMAAFAAALPALQRAVTTPLPGTTAPTLLQGGTDAIAGAALQDLVQGMAGRVGAALLSVETLPAVPGGSYRRIGLRLTLSAAWPVLAELLHAVEQARPRMVVDDLELHQTQLRVGEEDVLLNAAFTLYAFRGDAELRSPP